MKLIAAALLASFASPALADSAPPTFVPITLDEATYGQLLQYLNSVPYGYANPMIVGLGQLESEAVKNAAIARSHGALPPPLSSGPAPPLPTTGPHK